MNDIIECPECGSGNTGIGPAKGDLAMITIPLSCHSCKCEWVLHAKPDMLTITTTGEPVRGMVETTVEDFDVTEGKLVNRRRVLYPQRRAELSRRMRK